MVRQSLGILYGPLLSNPHLIELQVHCSDETAHHSHKPIHAPIPRATRRCPQLSGDVGHRRLSQTHFGSRSGEIKGVHGNFYQKTGFLSMPLWGARSRDKGVCVWRRMRGNIIRRAAQACSGAQVPSHYFAVQNW